jgi:hypothetical protein
MQQTPTVSSQWAASLAAWYLEDSFDHRSRAAAQIHASYDELLGQVSTQELVMARLDRSLWCQRAMQSTIELATNNRATDFDEFVECLSQIRGCITSDQALVLQDLLSKTSGLGTQLRLAGLLADHADPSCLSIRKQIQNLDPSGRSLRRIGPVPEARFRPIRKTARLDPNAWLQDARYGDYEFIDGDPDRVRIRGVELQSGDIGIVELNSPGDGILESFLVEPSLAPHAMLFVTRRIRDKQGKTLFQPSLMEIYEEGWRCIPLSTGLSSQFSWYSEWVRPSPLPSNVGEQLSHALDHLGPIAFDFQARKAPLRGDFSTWEQPCATCTNLIRIPFELIGITLPYPTTKIHSGARRNLERIGLGNLESIHTPTNILVESGFARIGTIDNGKPQWSLAQTAVLGRPELLHTFGGYFSQRDLQIEHLPDWRSVKHWRSAWESAKIAIGQSRGLISSIACKVASFDREAIPRSASPTAIAFYLRSAMESGYIVSNVLVPHLQRIMQTSQIQQRVSGHSAEILRLPEVNDLVKHALAQSSLERENWYTPISHVAVGGLVRNAFESRPQ